MWVVTADNWAGGSRMEKTAWGVSALWRIALGLGCVLVGVVMGGVLIAGGYGCSVRRRLDVDSVAISLVWNDETAQDMEIISGIIRPRRA